MLDELLKLIADEITTSETALASAESTPERISLLHLIANHRLLYQLLEAWQNETIDTMRVLSAESLRAELALEEYWATQHPEDNGLEAMRLFVALFRAWQSGTLNHVRFKVSV